MIAVLTHLPCILPPSLLRLAVWAPLELGDRCPGCLLPQYEGIAALKIGREQVRAIWLPERDFGKRESPILPDISEDGLEWVATTRDLSDARVPPLRRNARVLDNN